MKYSLQEALRELRNPKKNLKESKQVTAEFYTDDFDLREWEEYEPELMSRLVIDDSDYANKPDQFSTSRYTVTGSLEDVNTFIQETIAQYGCATKEEAEELYGEGCIPTIIDESLNESNNGIEDKGESEDNEVDEDGQIDEGMWWWSHEAQQIDKAKKQMKQGVSKRQFIKNQQKDFPGFPDQPDSGLYNSTLGKNIARSEYNAAKGKSYFKNKKVNEDQGRKRIKREINDKLISDLINPEYDVDGLSWEFIDKKTGKTLMSDSYVNAEKGLIELYNGWGDVIRLPIDGSAKAGSTKDINRYEVYEYVD